MVNKETAGSLHIVKARVMHGTYMILQLERCIKMMEMLVQLPHFALTVYMWYATSLSTNQTTEVLQRS
jgi:hypothetical protein